MGKTTTDYESDIPGQWTDNTQFAHNKSDNRGAYAELGYTRKWSDSHTLDIMVSYNHWGGPFVEKLSAETGVPGEILSDNYQEQDQSINVNSYEAKVDYTNQILPWLKLEAGFNGNYNHVEHAGNDP